jgi:hypothetical protein
MYNVLDDNYATKYIAGAIAVATIAAAATTESILSNTYAASNTHPGLSSAISAMIAPVFNQIAKPMHYLCSRCKGCLIFMGV